MATSEMWAQAQDILIEMVKGPGALDGAARTTLMRVAELLSGGLVISFPNAIEIVRNADYDTRGTQVQDEICALVGLMPPALPKGADPDPKAGEEEETSPPAHVRRFPVWGWLIIVFIVLGTALIALGLVAIRNVLDQKAEVPAPMAEPVVESVVDPLLVTAEPVVESVVDPLLVTAEPVVEAPATEVLASPQEIVFDGTTVTANFKGALPGYIDLRNTNREPGDESMYVIKFAADFPRIGILRLVCDDLCIVATFYSTPTSAGTDLLPLLKMGKVDESNPSDPELRRYMEAHGVNVGGEELAQNYATVFLGEIKATDGAFLVIRMKDNPELQVNNGGLISFSSDTEPFTLNLDGTAITDPTFVLE